VRRREAPPHTIWVLCPNKNGDSYIIETDCSFVLKSGKANYGVEHFYNGCAGRKEKGLEISLLAIVDVDAKQGYTLSVQQTPPANPKPKNRVAARSAATLFLGFMS
jgi:hypothetical protein